MIKPKSANEGENDEPEGPVVVEEEEDAEEGDDDDNDGEAGEENDIVPDLNESTTRGKRTAGGTSLQGNGRDNDSGSEASGSASLSDRRRLTGLSGRSGGGGGNLWPRRNKNGDSNSSINFASHLQSEKSLFSDKNIRSGSSLNNSTTSLNSLAPKRSFNASLYGSMSALSDSRLLNTRSPYYNGPIMFGGASAYSQKPHLKSNISSKLFKSNTGLAMMRPSASMSSLSVGPSSSSRRDTTSTAPATGTAKRILDLIDQYNVGPLAEIRQMASGSLLMNESVKQRTTTPGLVGQRGRFNETDSRSIRLQSPRTPYSRPNPTAERTQSQCSPLTTELQVPSMSQLVQMTKLQRSTEEIRRLAFQTVKSGGGASQSSLMQERDYKLPEESATVSQSKIRSTMPNSRAAKKAGREHGNRNRNDDVEAAESAVYLPEIKFPEMKEPPKIDIKIGSEPEAAVKSATTAMPAVVSAPASQKLTGMWSTSSSSAATTTKGSTASIFGGNNDKASNVMVPSNSYSNRNIETSQQQPGFRFSAPTLIPSAAGDQTLLSPIKINFEYSAPKSMIAEGNSNSNKNNNSSNHSNRNSVAGKLNAEATFKFGSAATEPTIKFGQSKESTVPTFAAAPPLKSGSCEQALGLPIKTTTSFGNQFKAAANSWECSACMLRNKQEDAKCVACQSAREKPKESSLSGKKDDVVKADANQQQDDVFKTLAASQASAKWECADCMLKNDKSASKCACCGSAQPVGKGEEVAAAAASVAPDNVFKRLAAAQKSTKWDCPMCMVANDVAVQKCGCCEAAKPGGGTKTTASASEVKPSNPFGGSSSQFSFGGANNDGTVSKSDDGKSVGFSKIMSQQNAKWECSACFARNEATRSKCECCEQAKPGADASTAPQFSFGSVSTASKFKFGFVPDDKKTDDDGGKKVTEAKSSSAGGFTFGMSSPATTSSTAAAKFTFGSAASTVTKAEPTAEPEKKPESGGFKFAMTSPATTESSSQKETPPAKKVGFTFGSATTPSSGGFQFGAAAKSDLVVKKDDEKADVSKATAAAAATTASPSTGFGSSMASTFGASDKLGTAGSAANAALMPIFGAGNGAAPGSQNKTTTAVDSSATGFGAISSPIFGAAAPAAVAPSPVKSVAPSTGILFGAPQAAEQTKTTEPAKEFAFGQKVSTYCCFRA